MSLIIHKTDEDWMKIALQYAWYAQKQGEVPIGSILIFEENIIGIGWNSSISTNDPTAHAEIIALRRGGQKMQNYRLINTTLYVTLEPCIMCFGAIINSRIKRLVFGANYKKSDRKCCIKSIFLHLKENYKLDIKNNIMENECSNILVDFFRNKRKKNFFK